PYAVTPLLVLAVLPAMGLTAWVTLTVAGLTMGMMLFLVASGLTLIFGLPHHPAHAGERGAGDEHADEHAADAIAQSLHHLAILDAGAHHEPNAGARQHQMHRGSDGEADEEREQAVGLDRGSAKEDAAAQARRLGQ